MKSLRKFTVNHDRDLLLAQALCHEAVVEKMNERCKYNVRQSILSGEYNNSIACLGVIT